MTVDSTQQSLSYQSPDGLQLHYRNYPSQSSDDDTPVVCLPGLTRNCRDFAHLAQRLAEKRRVLTPDLRGRGMSAHDPDWHNYHPQQYVADIWYLLGKLNLQQVIIVGTSLGGLLAMLMAHDRPQAVVAAVLNDVGPEIDPVGLTRVQASAGRLPAAGDWEEAARHVKTGYEIAFPDWPDSKWRQFVHTTYRETEDGTLGLMLDRNVGTALREGVSGLQQDPWKLFDAVSRKPLLVLRGEQSDILSEKILSKMKARSPGMVTATVPNRGHAPFLDEAEAIDAIEAFLDAI